MPTVTIYGASDDLVELEGDIRDEFYAKGERDQPPGAMLAFSDGSVISVLYVCGIWRVNQVQRGSAKAEKVEAIDAASDQYSDRLTLTGDLRWVVNAEPDSLTRAKER